MPKLFCVSDIHSFYDPLIAALDEAGFDKEDPNHWLIVCGDCLDRGDQSAQVLSFLQRIERKVIVKGNHEKLLEELCNRGYLCSHDYGNGTAKTVYDLGGGDEGYPFEECCVRTAARIATFIDDMVDYFETKNYIFVHGWLAPDYRNATKRQWEDAAWECGPDCAMNNLNYTDKTVVFGHWHTSYLWHWMEGTSEFGEGSKFDAYIGDSFIALDGCVAYSGKVNCVVLEDDFLEH